jgi:hypothetical protein
MWIIGVLVIQGERPPRPHDTTQFCCFSECIWSLISQSWLTHKERPSIAEMLSILNVLKNIKPVSPQLELHAVRQMLAREHLAPVVPSPRIPDSANVHYVLYISSDLFLSSPTGYRTSDTHSHRMSLNNWLQMRGEARRMKWETMSTGPQNMPTWTARAFSAWDI